MRRLLLPALLLAAACEQRAPIPVTYVPQAATPASAGTPAQQDARRLDRVLRQDAQRDRAQAADPAAGSMAGVPTPASNLEIGGGDAPQTTPQVGIPFR
jgi:hypothetical protein